ncbi:MAG TPA: NifB/NifX family molybdenum-iron cluster-binding protein [Spirochaetia bacterium]|nr:NifB/NifX family molybdenum-iron cluster-binding protein [Spirochaetales bacterium]HRW24217.1 NifB/NifX family molybdenum-iron cluster-binding protein [Spirochaetia bacterium]
MRYAVPTDDGETVGKVFGRASSFAIFDQADSSLVIHRNDGINAEHGAGTGAASFLADKGVNVVLAPEVGPKAAAGLAAAGIEVVVAATGTRLRAAIDAAIAG